MDQEQEQEQEQGQGQEQEPEQDLVTLSDIASRMQVSKPTVNRWKSRKDFPAVHSVKKFGRTRDGYLWDEVLQWCEERHLPDRTVQELDARRRQARLNQK